jgi:ABC-type branched-subunit amino acid transport system substrate-binding protein
MSTLPLNFLPTRECAKRASLLVSFGCMLIVVPLLLGCGRAERRLRLGRFDRDGQTGMVTIGRTTKAFPWVIWGEGQTLSGTKITDPSIREGDSLFRDKDFDKALYVFTEATQRHLSFPERESAHYRIASTYLAQGDPSKALSSLSDFYKASHSSPSDLDGPRALFLAFVYGADRNFLQSLAWFAKAERLKGRDLQLRPRMKEGVSEVLASIPPEEFEQMVGVITKNQPVLTALVANERARRRRADYAYAPFLPFLGELHTTTSSESENSATSLTKSEPQLVKDKLFVLLPLSGKYAGLGKKVQRGIELALSEVAPSPFEIQFKELAESKDDAYTQMWQLVSGNEGKVSFLGPLIADTADAVGDVARQSHVPVISFTKRPSFQVGEGVFRLGFTAKSQMARIGEYLSLLPGQKGYAVVAADDASGKELVDALKEAQSYHGIRPEFERTFPRANLDALSTLADEFEATQISDIVFIGSLEAATRFFSELSPSSRERIRPIGTALWDDNQGLSRSQEALNGAIFVSLFFKASSEPLIQNFVSKYTATYGEAPDFLAAQGYDGVRLLLEAKRLKDKGNVDLAEGLTKITSFQGLTGGISYAPSGEFSRKYPLIQFRDGSFSEVSSALAP